MTKSETKLKAQANQEWFLVSSEDLKSKGRNAQAVRCYLNDGYTSLETETRLSRQASDVHALAAFEAGYVSHGGQSA